jgi:hypothetical protein
MVIRPHENGPTQIMSYGIKEIEMSKQRRRPTEYLLVALHVS